MPLTSSAKKALKVEKRRKAENSFIKAGLKGAYKGAKIAVVKDAKDADKALSLLYREADMAAKKNVIHKNKAARLKSRMAKLMTK